MRHYPLHPGQRDTLSELFDREFVDSQEAMCLHLAPTLRAALHA